MWYLRCAAKQNSLNSSVETEFANRMTSAPRLQVSCDQRESLQHAGVPQHHLLESHAQILITWSRAQLLHKTFCRIPGFIVIWRPLPRTALAAPAMHNVYNGNSFCTMDMRIERDIFRSVLTVSAGQAKRTRAAMYGAAQMPRFLELYDMCTVRLTLAAPWIIQNSIFLYLTHHQASKHIGMLYFATKYDFYAEYQNKI